MAGTESSWNPSPSSWPSAGKQPTKHFIKVNVYTRRFSAILTREPSFVTVFDFLYANHFLIRGLL